MSKKGSERTEDGFQFDGWDGPNTTQVPDIFFDFIAPTLSEAELRVLIYILRRTYGFKKNSDAISLSQLVDGIKTRDGKVLDRGTGMSRKGVINGCAGLVAKGYVIKDTSRSELGDSDINVYRLRFRSDDRPAPPSRGVVNDVHHPSERRTPRVVNDVHPQHTDKQETVKQDVGDVFHAREAKLSTAVGSGGEDPPALAVPTEGTARLLHAFGISSEAAVELAATYPESHILAKLDLVEWLSEHRPRLIRDNPAGFLRRAIERDYQPPPDYLTPAQREAAAAARAQTEQEEERHLRAAEEAYRQDKLARMQQLAEHAPPQPIAGTTLTTETAWHEVLAELKSQVTGPIFTVYLKDTRLIACDGKTATIAAPSRYHAEELTKRFTPRIQHTLRTVLGQPITCQVVPLAELTESTEPSADDGTPSDIRYPTEGRGTRPRRAHPGGSHAAG